MSIDMEQFHGVFFDESQEHLDEMEHQLMDLNLEEPDAEQLNSIFRAAHSIKGGSGIFGFDALTGVTHVMENLLDMARQGSMTLTTPVVDLFLKTVDTLKVILDNYRNDEEIDQSLADSTVLQLEAVLADGDSEPSAGGLGESDAAAAHEEEQEQGFGFFDDADTKPASLEANTASEDEDGFGFFEPLTAQEEKETAQQVEDEQGFGFFEPLAEGSQSVTEEQENIDGFGFFEPIEESAISAPISEEKSVTPDVVSSSTKPVSVPKVESPPKSKPKSKPKTSAAKKPSGKSGATESSSIRVDTNKIDSLVNLVGELVITQSMLAMIGSEVQGEAEEKLQSALTELQRNTREIQESVMSMRMLPMHVTFNRFPRVVRDLSTKLGKKVDLQIEGGNTEIDKGMIEKLVDPLTHLVRNSIDHGVETIEKRLAAGKPETGVVILRAEQKGSSILISIIDDGAGLNRQRILDKAIENGLNVDVNMPDEQVWKLIFEAGFSTAAEVTDVSGRGVGMDVVRRNIEAIGGRIEIESHQGFGSEFHIHLPLTLAIVDGMCVEVGEQVFVVPLVNIIESIQPNEDQIKMISNDKLLWIREQYWPVIDLYKTMQIDNAITDPTKGIVVLLESSKKRFGLLIDGLLGQQQVVIKSLEQHYKRVSGVAGATIMGDGGVALILDVESLAASVKIPIPEAEVL
ncbi:chemotaxis protein CheA [Paraglaciecola sp.]|uniref:chemotaxis protein CheA n=1 Tax=Paraglaciecola sp. TaxID=1920173 RepID=UPI003EF1B7E9